MSKESLISCKLQGPARRCSSKNHSSGNAQASSSLKSLHLVAAVGSFDTVKYQSPLETVYVDNKIRKNFQGARDGTRNVAGADRRTKCCGADEDDDGKQERRSSGMSEERGAAG